MKHAAPCSSFWAVFGQSGPIPDGVGCYRKTAIERFIKHTGMHRPWRYFKGLGFRVRRVTISQPALPAVASPNSRPGSPL